MILSLSFNSLYDSDDKNIINEVRLNKIKDA